MAILDFCLLLLIPVVVDNGTDFVFRPNFDKDWHIGRSSCNPVYMPQRNQVEKKEKFDSKREPNPSCKCSVSSVLFFQSVVADEKNIRYGKALTTDENNWPFLIE